MINVELLTEILATICTCLIMTLAIFYCVYVIIYFIKLKKAKEEYYKTLNGKQKRVMDKYEYIKANIKVFERKNKK